MQSETAMHRPTDLMTNIPDILITTYLEMEPADFEPSFISDDRLEIREVVAPDLGYYRFMYWTVGGQWNWTDRLLLEDDDLRAILTDPCMQMYVLYYDGAPAGYIELVDMGEQRKEIAYFGLREPFWGRGLGKHLLSWGVALAFEEGVARVTLNTCNLDSPLALRNYQKRGFRVYDVTEKPMPDKEYIKLTAQQQ
ncbi:MAG: GNAT family N-acetyltransferase, partial [Chloroflexota bacterium]